VAAELEEILQMRTRYIVSWFIIIGMSLALLPFGAARAAPEVAEPFRAYYNQHQGIRVLGYPLTGLVEADGYVAQYFEKGRLEDHRPDLVAADWTIMYGRLAAELIGRGGNTVVSSTTLSYATLKRHHDPAYRHPAPEGFTTGVTETPAGVFVPYDPELRRAYGFIVPRSFWDYITRVDLFPGGWLHDIGLPMTDSFQVKAYKNGALRELTVQAFERTVLTSDPHNPPDWRIERGNIGADAVRLLPPLNTIEIPAPEARVTLPLHVLARAGWPGENLSVTLRWADGSRLIRTSAVLHGEDGRGVLIDCLDLPPEYLPRHPWTQAAQLEISDVRGAILAKRSVRVLHPDDPDTREIKLYWVVGASLKTELRRIPNTSVLDAAALHELLWGPGVYNSAGFTTMLPTPEQVLTFSGRTADWGPRVMLRSLRVVDGIALADFSKELHAYGGNSLRASLIHGQITRTLLQFPQVRDVRIMIEGEPDIALEP
jgi:Sporulation and spore germination